VLAPTNEAFSEAAYSLNITLTELLASPDLTSILQNHLLAYPLDVSNPRLFSNTQHSGTMFTSNLPSTSGYVLQCPAYKLHTN